MVVEETEEELRSRRARVMGEYARERVQLSRGHVLDERGRRLQPAAYERWRAPHVRRYNELAAELTEINRRLRELRDEAR